jgi:hypothetical protein
VRLFRIALLVALALWVWRRIAGTSSTHQRAGMTYDDGSSFVLDASSAAFERFATIARRALSS